MKALFFEGEANADLSELRSLLFSGEDKWNIDGFFDRRAGSHVCGLRT